MEIHYEFTAPANAVLFPMEWYGNRGYKQHWRNVLNDSDKKNMAAKMMRLG